MAEEPQEKKERNMEIVRDRANGMGYVDMVVKYRITPQRIYKILKKNVSKTEKKA